MSTVRKKRGADLILAAVGVAAAIAMAAIFSVSIADNGPAADNRPPADDGSPGGAGTSDTVVIAGHTVGTDARELVFSGDEITDIDALTVDLLKLPYLESVDLGSFYISDEELERLAAAFPNIDFRYTAYKNVAGGVYPADAENIDLEGKAVDFPTLEGELREFADLKSVTFGNDAVRAADMDKLKAAFPGVTFTAVLTYPVQGTDYREDAESVDLSGKAIGDGLLSELSKLPSLKSVDLSETGVATETLIGLKKAMPNVAFHASVRLGGKTFDSEVKEIDLNSKKVGGFDLFFDTFALFNGLEKIEMCDCGFSNEQMATLRDAYPNTKFVWRIYLGKWSLRTDATAFSVLIYASDKYERMTSKDIEVLKYCTDLQALDIGHQAVEDISVIGEYLKDLRVLILADNKLTDISPLANLPHLHYLEIFVNRVSDITPLAECRELVDLNISYNSRISDIKPILDLPLIERLWLTHTNVSRADFDRLCKAYPEAKVIYEAESSIDKGWRSHARYRAMIDMFHNNYMSEEFSKYDGLAG